MPPTIKLVVGLGNPGKSYVRHRHNLGYRVIDRLHEGPPEPLLLFKPESVFMNEAGHPVAELVRRKGLAASELLVVCDDFSIPLGALRLRTKGSSGGHNGLDSILQSLGTAEIPRLRLGIGPVPDGVDPAAFVLANFPASEARQVDDMIQHAVEAVRVMTREGWDAAMNRFNRKAA
ncbi:MAG TPA: aminoacyl-tRNA hydrolase [Elusimicrobiota bacterium]|nr:aminoacyl-tRNA hydrolase [Elusimicrobiota bacterium]